MQILIYILIGLIGGTLGGALGIGGGAFMVPVFVYFFGMSQLQAQGTSLAVMLPPIFLFAVLRYYSAGNVNVQIAAFVALGFILGAYFGANLIQKIPDANIRRAFGVFLMIVGMKMVFFK